MDAEKNVFLNLNWKSKKHILIWEIRPPYAVLDYPSALLENKGALLHKRRSLFKKYFDSILFILSKQFINFCHIFRTFILMKYNMKWSVWCKFLTLNRENEKFNEILQIKTLTFPRFSRKAWIQFSKKICSSRNIIIWNFVLNLTI